jgi:hypothetical protein
MQEKMTKNFIITKRELLSLRGYSKIHKKCGGVLVPTAYSNFRCMNCNSIIYDKEFNIEIQLTKNKKKYQKNGRKENICLQVV